MAKIVGYFENIPFEHEAYSEGPFVATKMGNDNYRVEVGLPGSKCPTVPTGEVWGWMEENGFFITGRKYEVFETVDVLNLLVNEGKLNFIPNEGWMFFKDWPDGQGECGFR